MYLLIKKVDNSLIVIFSSENLEDCHSEAKSNDLNDYVIFHEKNGITTQIFPSSEGEE